MANLTLTIPDDVLLRARKRALNHGTSVNAVVREYLHGYGGSESETEALREFLALAEAGAGASGPEGRTWTRDSAHER